VVYPIQNNKLGKADTISLGKPWPKNKICTTGIAVTKDGTSLYTVTKEDNTLYTINPATKAITHKTRLAAEAYSCLLSPDEKTLYISLWGGDEVAVQQYTRRWLPVFILRLTVVRIINSYFITAHREMYSVFSSGDSKQL